SACAYTIEWGEKKIQDGKFLNENTNNFAEWMGLVAGLERAVECLEPLNTEIFIFSDSELVVRQVTGVYKVKNPILSSLRMNAMNLLSKFKSFEITHVKREYNKECDEKVNEILDSCK
ncbi:MAG: ribonuclease HI family protein, partial [bacterium]|nr:ribonuclease HI family protein [bacterium]